MNGYLWVSTVYPSNAINGRTLCNHCNGKLNKYIISRKTTSDDNALYLDNFDANIQCNSAWNTSLASIHSEHDLDEARILCQICMCLI